MTTYEARRAALEAETRREAAIARAEATKTHKAAVRRYDATNDALRAGVEAVKCAS